MGKLIRNDFKTVLKSKLLIGGVLFALFLLFLESSAGGAAMTVHQVFDVAEDYGEAVAFANLTQILLNRALLTYFIMFIPSFIIGYDFDGGMIRNKIMAGYSRIQIYFSSLIVSFVTCLFYGLFMFIYNIVVYVNAFTPEVILKWMSLPEAGEIIIAAAIFNIFIIFALCAVSVAIMMMLNNKVLSIVFIFVVMLVAMLFGEEMRRYAIDPNPTISYYDLEKQEVVTVDNIFYVAPDDPMKKVFIALDGVNIFYSAADQNGILNETDMILSDAPYYIGGLFDIILFTGAGVYVFNKRNLK